MATLPELLKTTVELEGSDLHLSIGIAAAGARARRAAAARAARADADRHQGAGLQRAHRRAEEALRGDAGARLLVRHPRPGPLPLQHVQPEGRGRRGLPPDSRAHPRRSRSCGLPAVIAQAGRAAARPGAGHRPDRQRQVDDAGGDDRQDQHRAARPHPHHRGPDRVPAPAQELPGQPARGAQRHAELHQRAARRAPRRPRRRADRRNARPRDRRSRRCASPRPAT